MNYVIIYVCHTFETFVGKFKMRKALQVPIVGIIQHVVPPLNRLGVLTKRTNDPSNSHGAWRILRKSFIFQTISSNNLTIFNSLKTILKGWQGPQCISTLKVFYLSSGKEVDEVHWLNHKVEEPQKPRRIEAHLAGQAQRVRFCDSYIDLPHDDAFQVIELKYSNT